MDSNEETTKTEEVITESNTNVEKVEEKVDVTTEVSMEIKVEENREVKVEEKPEVKVEEKNEVKIEEKPEEKPEVKVEVKVEEKNEVKVDVPIVTATETTKIDKKPSAKPKSKAKPSEKKTGGESEQMGRQRSKTLNTNTFEQQGKNKPQVKNETKPIETIGENRFKNLLGMFDTTKKTNTETPNNTASFPQELKKINNDKVNMFDKGANTSSTDNKTNEPRLSGMAMMSNSIKDRMENLLKLGKEKNNTEATKMNDPVLLGYKKAMDDQVDENEDEHASHSGGADDLDISDNEEEKKDEDPQEEKHEEVKCESNDIDL